MSDYGFEYPSVKECERIAAEITFFFQNDVFSYQKEQDMHENYFHDILSVLCRDGLSLQHAIDHVGEILNDCYQQWYSALANMPICGKQINNKVQKYIEGCRLVPLGNLDWNYASNRYFGTVGLEIRKTRILNIVKAPEADNGSTNVLLSLP